MTDFRRGFASLAEETVVPRLPTRGTLPAWLSGTLIRNGPARFEVGARKYRHWFDGLAMLHAFSLRDGSVSYANRFLQSHPYRKAVETGRITYGEFATDPCRSLFNRLYTLFVPEPADNGLVNVARIADRFVALTETPLPVEFDPRTLETLGFLEFEERVPGPISTAHPHYDPREGALISYATHVSRKCAYNVYRIARGSTRQALIGSVAVDEPAYMHSFGLTGNHAILVEFPLFFSPLGLALKRKAYIGNARWKPERGARFLLMDLRDGHLAGTWHADAFFAFHHVNAFERDGEVVVDLCAYPDAAIIDRLFLDRLQEPDGGALPGAELRRYRLRPGQSRAVPEPLSDEAIDLPRTHYARVNGRDYRYAYGMGIRKDVPADFLDQLVKLDVQKGQARAWHADGCYPGEPVFVAAPDAAAEDDGVVLCVVLDARKDKSFLLILAGDSFEEIARAEVPHAIPFGLHGQFYPEVLA